MCCGDLQKNTIIVGITAIVCSIIFLIVGYPDRDNIRYGLFYDNAKIELTRTIFAMWVLIGLAAAALVVGAFLKNLYIVLAWLVVLFVCGISLIIFYTGFITKGESEFFFFVLCSVRLSLVIAFFVIWFWVSLVYFLNLCGYTAFCRKSRS